MVAFDVVHGQDEAQKAAAMSREGGKEECCRLSDNQME